jgi:hypothetical protein
MAQATTGLLGLKYDAICMIAYAPPCARSVLRADKFTGAVQVLFNSHTICADSDWLALATHVLARYFHLDCAQPQASSRHAFLMRRQAVRSHISQPGPTTPLGLPLSTSSTALTGEAALLRAASRRWFRIMHTVKVTELSYGHVCSLQLWPFAAQDVLSSARDCLYCAVDQGMRPFWCINVRTTQWMMLKHHNHSRDNIQKQRNRCIH